MSQRNRLARAWAARDCPVLPVGTNKRPLTRHGLLDATTELNTISEWWSRWPEANVAIRTGEISGLVVLDVDGEDGAEELRRVEAGHGTLPRTASVTTPRGGTHYYFRHDGVAVKTTAGQVAPGIDVRGDGGYVLVPPSVGANGRPYCWDEEAPPAPMPDWLRAATTQPPLSRPPKAPATTWVGMIRQGLRDGERNAGLARLVGHLLARGVDAPVAAELAHLVNARSRPPLADLEVDRVVASIAGRDVRRRTAVRR